MSHPHSTEHWHHPPHECQQPCRQLINNINGVHSGQPDLQVQPAALDVRTMHVWFLHNESSRACAAAASRTCHSNRDCHIRVGTQHCMIVFSSDQPLLLAQVVSIRACLKRLQSILCSQPQGSLPHHTAAVNTAITVDALQLVEDMNSSLSNLGSLLTTSTVSLAEQNVTAAASPMNGYNSNHSDEPCSAAQLSQLKAQVCLLCVMSAACLHYLCNLVDTAADP